MAATLRVPTIFTAVDRITAVVSKISRGISTFSSKAQTGLGRANKLFSSLTPVFSEAGNQLIETAKAAAVAGAIIGGITFSAKSLIDYEKAVASFRTIVSDLSNKDFKKYRDQISLVAKDSKGMASTIDVASSFEKIAGLNAKFADTADGIGQVSKAAIVLSKASGDELGTSAENLVGIMNQFSLGADQANRVINVLAAGQAVGAASISQASESYKNFGSVAKGSNISLEQSIGLIQTLGKFSIFGAEAGTALRGATLRLQKAGAGYQSGQFKINDALEQAKKKYDSLSTSRKKDAFALKLFGAENITAGKILLSNIETYKNFTKGVTGTSEAQKAAAINTGTLSAMLDGLTKSWVTYVTSNDKANEGLEKAKTLIAYVTNNLDNIVSVGVSVIKFFAIFKGLLLASQAILWVYNVALGVTGALTGIVSVAVGKSNVALGAYNIVTKSVTAAQWLWNAAMTANPIGLIIVGIAALIALIAVIVKKWDDWGAALAIFTGPLGIIISLIQSFRRNWDMISKAFKEGGIIAGLKAIGKTILDALIQPIQQLLGIIGKLTGFKWASNAAASLNSFRQDLGVSMDGNSQSSKPALTSPQMKSDQITRTNNQHSTLGININDPGKQVSSTTLKGPLVPSVSVSTTQGQR